MITSYGVQSEDEAVGAGFISLLAIQCPETMSKKEKGMHNAMNVEWLR
jgi:hypothetical protein